MHPSHQMRSLGVVQIDDPRLRQPSEPFDLPIEATAAQRLVVRLITTMDRIAEVHVFGKGMGLAAPQISVDRAATVVRPAERGSKPIVLFNPEVVGHSDELDEQYEGCLSFFDVRGLVPRPLRIDVAHTAPSGRRLVARFERGLARLVAHEVDHLHGLLYIDRMRPGVAPIDVDEYRGTGSSWHY